jgi:hypothetical protein
VNRLLLASVTLLPAIPGAIHLVRAWRARSARRARSIVVWGASTMGAGAAVYAGVALSTFPAVAALAPEHKSAVLSLGLARGSLALSTGLVVGGLLCVLAGVTRSLFKTETERRGPGGDSRL